MLSTAMLTILGPGQAATEPRSLEGNRQWDALPAPGDAQGRETLASAAQVLEGWRLHFAGVTLDGERLQVLARTPEEEPLVRAVREALGRPVDLQDMLLWLDDLAHDGARVAPHREIWLPSGRARRHGVLIHPDDVFGGEPRRYGGTTVPLSEPEEPEDLVPAEDGDPLGPRWSARFANPGTEEARLEALEAAGARDFAARLRELFDQLRAQGAEVYLTATVRHRERGYLMYGAFRLSRAAGAREVKRRVAELERLNRSWGLEIPIRWRHPDGWRATVAAAREMADAYDVVFATRAGARESSHYDGRAADFAALDLPRRLTLTGPRGGPERTFDLSDPHEPRDLNLTPALVDWIERHFALDKLRGDYPHWSDARAR